MEAKFSNKVKEVISLAREEALRLGHDYIGTEHLMLGMIRDGESSGVELLVKSGVSLDQLRQSIEHSTTSTTKSTFDKQNLLNIPLTKQAEKVLRLTYLEAKYFKTNLVETDHLLMAILRDEDNVATQILEKYQVYYEGKPITQKEVLGKPTTAYPARKENDKVAVKLSKADGKEAYSVDLNLQKENESK